MERVEWGECIGRGGGTGAPSGQILQIFPVVCTRIELPSVLSLLRPWCRAGVETCQGCGAGKWVIVQCSVVCTVPVYSDLDIIHCTHMQQVTTDNFC